MPVILQINVTANWGSTGKIAEGIGKVAMKNGFDSYVAYGRHVLPSESKLIKIGGKMDYLCHGIECRIFDNHGLGSKSATGRFLREVDSIRPDIIHLHNIHGYYLNFPMLFEYTASKKIPVVWTLHDCWPFTGHCAHYDFCGCDKWKAQCFSCPQKKAYPRSFVFDRSKKNYLDKKYYFTLPDNMTLVPVSSWLANQVRESFLRDYPCRVIHNGIDLEVFHPYDQDEMKKKFGFAGKKLLAGVASKWSARKGLEDFIELAGLIDKDTQIVLVGVTSKQAAKLPGNITAIPRTDSVQELAQLYSAADVLLNPTWEDNYPTTNLESLACGTPVVTYQTGGSVESVDGNIGTSVPKGKIAELLAVSMTIRKDAVKCRNYAEAHFNMTDVFEQYISLYKELVK